MQVTWGKICLKKAPWKKKRLPPRTKTQFARNQLNAFIWGSHKTSIHTNTSIFIQYLSLQRGHMSLERAQTSLREYIYISLYIYVLNITIYCISLNNIYHYILYIYIYHYRLYSIIYCISNQIFIICKTVRPSYFTNLDCFERVREFQSILNCYHLL